MSKTELKYMRIGWPDCQALMPHDGFRDECILLVQENGGKDDPAGPDEYMVPVGFAGVRPLDGETLYRRTTMPESQRYMENPHSHSDYDGGVFVPTD